MKERLIAVVAGLVLPVAVFGSETQVAASGGPVVIGVSMPGGGSPVHDALRHEAEQAAVTLGVQTAVEDCKWDFGRQSVSIRNFVTQRVQGILIDNIFTTATDPYIEEAANAGIPVVTVNETKPNTDKFLVHVGGDHVEVGREAAQFIIKKLGNTGSVIEFEGWGGWPSTVGRKAGFEEVIKKSNVKLLVSQSANWSRETARYLMEGLIKEYSFDAIFAANDDMILGAIEAMSAAKIDPSTKVTVGVDATPDGLQYVREGKLSATFDLLPSKQVVPALQYLVGYIKKKTLPPQKVILVKPELVTKESLPGG